MTQQSSSGNMVQKTDNGIRIRNQKGDTLDLSQDEARRLTSEVQSQIGGSSGSQSGSKQS